MILRSFLSKSLVKSQIQINDGSQFTYDIPRLNSRRRGIFWSRLCWTIYVGCRTPHPGRQTMGDVRSFSHIRALGLANVGDLEAQVAPGNEL